MKCVRLREEDENALDNSDVQGVSNLIEKVLGSSKMLAVGATVLGVRECHLALQHIAAISKGAG